MAQKPMSIWYKFFWRMRVQHAVSKFSTSAERKADAKKLYIAYAYGLGMLTQTEAKRLGGDYR